MSRDDEVPFRSRRPHLLSRESQFPGWIKNVDVLDPGAAHRGVEMDETCQMNAAVSVVLDTGCVQSNGNRRGGFQPDERSIAPAEFSAPSPTAISVGREASRERDLRSLHCEDRSWI